MNRHQKQKTKNIATLIETSRPKSLKTFLQKVQHCSYSYGRIRRHKLQPAKTTATATTTATIAATGTATVTATAAATVAATDTAIFAPTSHLKL